MAMNSVRSTDGHSDGQYPVVSLTAVAMERRLESAAGGWLVVRHLAVMPLTRDDTQEVMSLCMNILRQVAMNDEAVAAAASFAVRVYGDDVNALVQSLVMHFGASIQESGRDLWRWETKQLG
jgi:hypothetical protein